MTVTETILSELRKDNKRFFACDNISNYLTSSRLSQLEDELTGKFAEVLKTLIIDIENDPNSKDTPRRLAKMYLKEIFSGRYQPQPKATAFPNEGDDKYTGMIVVRVEIKSVCAHHHQEISGIAYIGVIPNGKVLGLSKYIRIAQWVARRGQLQEELTNQIANKIKLVAQTENVAVHIRAQHGCCTNRGIMAHDSTTQTTVLYGEFKESDVKKEFFDNINFQHLGNR